MREVTTVEDGIGEVELETVASPPYPFHDVEKQQGQREQFS